MADDPPHPWPKEHQKWLELINRKYAITPNLTPREVKELADITARKQNVRADKAVDEGHVALCAKDYEAALAKANHALGIVPDHKNALALQAEATAQLANNKEKK